MPRKVASLLAPSRAVSLRPQFPGLSISTAIEVCAKIVLVTRGRAADPEPSLDKVSQGMMPFAMPKASHLAMAPLCAETGSLLGSSRMSQQKLLRIAAAGNTKPDALFLQPSLSNLLGLLKVRSVLT